MKLRLLILIFMFSTHAEARDLVLGASEPDAQVSEVTQNGGVDADKILGKTPLEIKNLDPNTDHLFKIEKTGFSPVYVPVLSMHASQVSVQVKLRHHAEWIPEDAKLKASDLAEQQVESILTVQMLLDQRRIAEGLTASEKLVRDYPSSTGAQLVHANAILLSGQRDQAIRLYQALSDHLPPAKSSLKNTLGTLIQKLQGGRK